MRYLLLSIPLFLLAAKPLLAQDQLIQLSSEEVLLEDVITELEARYTLLFSYRQEDIEGLRVRPPKDALQLTPFFASLLRDSELIFEIVDQRFVLLSQRSISERLTLKVDTIESIQLCGTVLDSLTGEPLVAANVYYETASTGTTTTLDGRFKLEVPPEAKNDTIIISYVGYQEQRIPVNAIRSSPCAEVLLNYYSFGEDFLVVREYLTDGILTDGNGSFTKLQPGNMGTLPGQLEPDVLNTIQFLPGVSSLDGSPAGVGIQGGTPDQNLILWEGIPVYHTAHYFGAITAINPYIVDDVSVYTGGFGAEYGGRISGVIELESDVSPQDGNTISAGTNLIHGFLDGQLISNDERLSVIYSLRQSTTSLWQAPNFRNISKRVQQGILVQNVDLNQLPEGIQVNDELSFFDTNVKLDYSLSEKAEVSVSGFYTNNDFEDFITDNDKQQTQTDTFSLQSNGLQLSWQQEWQPHWRTKLLALHTDYGYKYAYSVLNQNQTPNKIGDKRSRIKEQQIHLITDYENNRQQQLQLGYQLIRYDVDFDVTRNQVNDGSGSRDFLSNLHVLYASLKTDSGKKIGVEVGLRYNYYEKVNRQYLEPRLRLWFNLKDNLNMYLSGGKYYQYLSQLIEFKGDKASIETPVWGLAGSKDVPVLDANHFQWRMVFRPNTWLIDVQAYLKKVEGLTSLASGFDEGLSNRFHLGSANIQGVSLLVKKRWKNYKSWLSYAWTNIDHRFPTFFDQEFTAAIEQRHRLRWAHMWNYKQFEFSLGWNISSGHPYSNRFDFTLTTSDGMGAKEVVVPVENEFNGSRLQAEHQLDASILYHIESDRQKKAKGIVGVSFFNIYHQRNIYSRELYIDDSPNMPASLDYSNKVNMGFTPSFLVRINW